MNRPKGLYVDEQAVRLVAALVSIVTAALMLTGWPWAALLLAVDFAIRAFTTRTSPLAFIAKAIVRKAGWQPKPIFAPPKKFAALMGFVFSLTIFVLLLLPAYTAAAVTAAILLACAVLESGFKICLGCYVYNWLIAPFKNALQKNNPPASL